MSSATQTANSRVLPFCSSFAEPLRLPLLVFTASRIFVGDYSDCPDLRNNYSCCVPNGYKIHISISCHRLCSLTSVMQPQTHEWFGQGWTRHLNRQRLGREKVFFSNACDALCYFSRCLNQLDFASPGPIPFSVSLAHRALYLSISVVATYSHVNPFASFVRRAVAVHYRKQFGLIDTRSIGAL